MKNQYKPSDFLYYKILYGLHYYMLLNDKYSSAHID